MITDVRVNFTERTYFNDYNDVRSDTMCGVTLEKVERAIDKLVRRYRKHQLRDCMFVANDDNTGWRLCYDYDRELFDKGVHTVFLRLRHYTNMSTESWDTEKSVSVAYAKSAIMGL